jgi:phosphatidylserine/phosphatidylglycerophosphate/cardiolipin synthase-like enzyme
LDLDSWFLTPLERGNPASAIDRTGDGRAWSEGNAVTPLIDGACYFERLVAAFGALGAGDQVRFTDWRGDPDERLVAGSPDAAQTLVALAARGVDVRGLLWRSHSDRLSFSAKENRTLADEVNDAGGEVLLDERVRRAGSHHQKLIVLRRPTLTGGDVAFVGGIDLSHGRRDDHTHTGDPQAVELDRRYGVRPPWHDAQLEVRGPAVGDLDRTFRERWEDPTPLDHSNALRALVSRAASRERRAEPLPDAPDDPPACGTHAVQVLRTYPARRPRYDFAPAGERSVARAFAKAVRRARRLVYIEDQYFWSVDAAEVLARALRDHSELHLIVVVPRYPDKDGRFSGPPSRIAQERAIAIVRAAGGDRVGVYDLENEEGTPVYVHAKVCVIDDVWATVGSDNMNRRSWTHDSELSCAVIDSTVDHREPVDPGGLGDRSRRFARDLRMALWVEHLGLSADDPCLLDPDRGFAAWREAAVARDAWSDGDRHDAPPRGRARVHHVQPVGERNRWWSRLVRDWLFDPDGRPARLRKVGRF